MLYNWWMIYFWIFTGKQGIKQSANLLGLGLKNISNHIRYNFYYVKLIFFIIANNYVFISVLSHCFKLIQTPGSDQSNQSTNANSRSLSETAAYILAVEVLCYLLCSGQEWRYFLSNPISNEHMYVCIQSIV